MKIGHSVDPHFAAGGAPPQKAGGNQVSGANSGAAASVSGAGVPVTVSKLAKSLGAAGASSDSDMDMGKVEAMRNAIAQGTFTVNAEAIANKMLSNAQEMLNRTRG